MIKCVWSVSGDEMMCPLCKLPFARKPLLIKGFRLMIMKGREYKGYGYISQEGIKSKDFDYLDWACIRKAIRKQDLLRKKINNSYLTEASGRHY